MEYSRGEKQYILPSYKMGIKSAPRERSSLSWLLLAGLFSLTLTGCASNTNVKWTVPVIGGSVGAFLGSQMADGKTRFLTIILGAAAGIAGGMAVEKYRNKTSNADVTTTPLESLRNLYENKTPNTDVTTTPLESLRNLPNASTYNNSI